MSQMSGIDLMVDKLEEAKEEIIYSLAMDHVKNFEEYKRLTGTFKGLVFAIDVIRDVEKRILEGDDE